jgi:Zn-dependent M28 family amino/carboxypeptidase
MRRDARGGSAGTRLRHVSFLVMAWLAGLCAVGAAAHADNAATDPAAVNSGGHARARPGDVPRGNVRLATYRRHIERLASDEFGGRKPGTADEARTLAYLKAEFERLGLRPATPAGYEQQVPIVEHTFASDASLVLGSRSLRYPQDAVIGTRRITEQAMLLDSPLVFAGYGIVAPEYGWNDYAGLDVRGKTVVVLINDPGFASGDPALFRGRAMTYYGRWTYKVEEAARQGAAGILIVHETEPASYPWDVVQNGWTGPQLGLETADGNIGRAMIEGWITREAAAGLFREASLDFESAKRAAGQRGFRAVDLRQMAQARVRAVVRRSRSANVAALVRGRTRPDEYVIYCAHWDHLGRSLAGADRVFNGAIDNATGVAGLLAIAEALVAGPAPGRSVLFLAVTAEEAGLLGSEYYAAHPLVPLARTVGVLNMDAIAFGGPTRDVTVVGWRSSELQELLERAARRQQRVLKPEPTPERGFFFRSDNFSFARVGVPALYLKLGIDDIEQGRDAAVTRDAQYYAERYHKPGDEYVPERDDLRGGVQDLDLLLDVGRQLGKGRNLPRWAADSEFRAIRERSLSEARQR